VGVGKEKKEAKGTERELPVREKRWRKGKNPIRTLRGKGKGGWERKLEKEEFPTFHGA